MKIGLDMMGGDYAPLEAVKGVRQYLDAEKNPADLILFGDESTIRDLLNRSSKQTQNISISFMHPKWWECMNIPPRHSKKNNSHQ